MPYNLKSISDALNDYSQLGNAYPNANKFMSALKDAAYRSVPTTEQMRDPNFIIDNAGIGGIIKPKGGNWLDTYAGSPEKASEYLHSIDIPGIKYLDASSRNTDKGTRNFVTFGDEYPQIVKRAGSLDELQEKNLNKRLIEKYLSEGKLSPDDMAQYEQNALAMETPLLQRYNVENAEMQIPNTKQRAKSLGFMTQPSKEQYHLTRNDWENNIPDLTKSDLGFHTGSIDQANYRGKVFDDNAVGQSVIPIAPHKYTNYLKLNDLGSFHADAIAPQLEKKKILAKGKAKQIQSAIDNDWKLTDQYDQQMRDVLSQHDIDAIKYANKQEGEGLSYAHINPSMIRSRFAAFDPLRKNSSSIMASGLLGDLALKYANDEDQGYAKGGSVDKDSLQLNKPQRTPSHPDKSHIVKTMVDGKEKIIRFGEQGAETAGKPKEGESDRMTAKRESFKARHAKNIAKGPSSAAYWANKVKWAEGGEVDIRDDEGYLDDLDRLKKAYERSNFGPNDSVIASTIHHPIEAAKRAKDSLMRSIDTAAGVPREILDESSAFPFGIAPSMDEQAQAGLDLAGLAQTGAMPFAPESAGGTLGMLIKPMKASEAYGRIEGRPLYVTQADRTKVGGKFLGGPGFSRLQLEDPEYAEALAAWAVQNPSIASTIINGSRQAGEHDPVFTTFIGAPDQHRSNQMVFDYIYNDFKKASKKSDLFTPEKLDLMNERLANYYKDKSTKENLFPENINILDKNLKKYANTFDKRAAIAEVIGGKGIGGKKGQIIDYDKLLRSTSDQSFLDVPSGSLGNRLFTLNGEFLENRHDLHPAFPTILQGEDLGLVYQPVPRELVMKDFYNKIRQEKGREPGYFDWALGYPPSQLITEDLLTEMQRAGYAKGGEVKDLHKKYEESDYGYGNRPDKTKKGLGYFGELERPDGTGVMTEYSIGVPIHGEEMDVPTLVPTLTPDEIRLILHMQDGDDMPRSIVHKAIDHAHQRLSEGKPIFATEEDLYAHGGIVDVLHNDAIEQIMKAFMDSMADDEEPSAPAVSIEITTQNTETPRRGKIPKSIAREAKHG